MKIALVVGHTELRKGAFSNYFKQSEWDFYNEVLSCLKSPVDIYKHNPLISGYTSRIKNTAKKLNKERYDLIISLHFNSSDSPKANGCETLYYFKSKKGKYYSTKFSKIVHEETNIKVRNNGLKALSNKNDRGFAMVFQPIDPVIMIEPFFGSNYGDCSRIGDTENIARIIDLFIKDIRS